MQGVTLDQGQIARIAGVSRAAVGNWKSRHEDFPVADSAGRFEFLEIEDWLIKRAKIDRRVEVRDLLWALADALRDSGFDPEEALDAIQAIAVYLAVDEGRVIDGRQVVLDESHRWASVRRSEASDLCDRLSDVVDSDVFRESGLGDLIRSGFDVLRRVAPNVVRGLVDAISEDAGDPSALLELVQTAATRVRSADRFAAEIATPASLRRLMLAVAGETRGTVLDLACGEGGLLAAAHAAKGARTLRLSGVEINDGAIRAARRNLLIAGIEADLHHADALQLGPDDLPEADLVLLDPPFGQKDWGDADLYVDPKWLHGAPSPKGSEFAWLQLALLALGPVGRSVVVMPASLRSLRGRDGEIRRSVVEAGLLEALIALPPRLRPDHSVPSDLWVLSNDPDRVARHSVLFIDASDRGTRARTTTSLADEEIGWIEHLVVAWRERWWEPDELSWSATLDEIVAQDCLLEPKRYQPSPQLNWLEEWARADELRGSFEQLSPNVTRALASLSRASLLRERELEFVPLESVFLIQRGAIRAGKATGPESQATSVITRTSLRTGLPEAVSAEPIGREPVPARSGDFLLTLVGEEVGVALVNEMLDGLPVSRDCLILRPRSTDGSAAWFLAWFQSSLFKHQLERLVVGSTIRRASLRDLSELSVPLMPDDPDVRGEIQDLAEAQSVLRMLEDRWHEFNDLATDLLFVTDVMQDWADLLGGEGER